MLLRKIFEVPKPSMNRPGPAASWTTRASIATWTGWRVNGEMIPQPTVSRSVSLRHQPRHDGGRARLHPVLSPPRVRLREPDRVQSRLVHHAGAREHLVERLHRQLHDPDAERRTPSADEPVEVVGPACTSRSSAASTLSTCWLTIGCSTRWPIEPTWPARSRPPPSPSTCARRRRGASNWRLHRHHRADALALRPQRGVLGRSLLELLEVDASFSPPIPSGTLHLRRPVRVVLHLEALDAGQQLREPLRVLEHRPDRFARRVEELSSPRPSSRRDR